MLISKDVTIVRQLGDEDDVPIAVGLSGVLDVMLNADEAASMGGNGDWSDESDGRDRDWDKVRMTAARSAGCAHMMGEEKR